MKMKTLKRKLKKLKPLWTSLIIVLIFLAFGALYINCNEAVYTVTITEKVTVDTQTNKAPQMLIYAENKYGSLLVFENSDSFIRGKNNSKHVFEELEEGHTYKLTVVGSRIPIFNMYENIIGYSEVTGKTK